MAPLEIGIVGLIVVFALIAVRVPIAVALGIVSFFGIWAITSLNAAWGIVTAIPFDWIGEFVFSAVPMFLLMGYIASKSGMTAGIFGAMRIFLWRVPGALACASVAACALFAAASGSSVATAAAMSRISIPEMLKAKYDEALATGTIAASGTLGSLIPPSILMILYGIFAEQSIGKLFIAGFLPGLLSALIYMGMIMGRVVAKPSLAPKMTRETTRQEKIAALRDIWPFPPLVFFVLGGIFFGWFTPTEAGAVGASFAFVLAIIRRSMNWSIFRQIIVEATESTAAIYIIAVTAVIFTRFMSISGVPAYLADVLLSVGSHPVILIAQISLIYIVLGMFIDSIGLMLITLPIVLPMLHAGHVDLIWFGIIVIKLLEIGLITPPIGLNVYMIKGALGDSIALGTVFRGCFWFLAMDVVTLALIVIFPQITLWLPDLMW
jgi:C4-dicarboxylate transporter, DctM subunit